MNYIAGRNQNNQTHEAMTYENRTRGPLKKGFSDDTYI